MEPNGYGDLSETVKNLPNVDQLNALMRSFAALPQICDALNRIENSDTTKSSVPVVANSTNSKNSNINTNINTNTATTSNQNNVQAEAAEATESGIENNPNSCLSTLHCNVNAGSASVNFSPPGHSNFSSSFAGDGNSIVNLSETAMSTDSFPMNADINISGINNVSHIEHDHNTNNINIHHDHFDNNSNLNNLMVNYSELQQLFNEKLPQLIEQSIGKHLQQFETKIQNTVEQVVDKQMIKISDQLQEIADLQSENTDGDNKNNGTEDLLLSLLNMNQWDDISKITNDLHTIANHIVTKKDLIAMQEQQSQQLEQIEQCLQQANFDSGYDRIFDNNDNRGDENHTFDSILGSRGNNMNRKGNNHNDNNTSNNNNDNNNNSQNSGDNTTSGSITNSPLKLAIDFNQNNESTSHSNSNTNLNSHCKTQARNDDNDSLQMLSDDDEDEDEDENYQQEHNQNQLCHDEIDDIGDDSTPPPSSDERGNADDTPKSHRSRISNGTDRSIKSGRSHRSHISNRSDSQCTTLSDSPADGGYIRNHKVVRQLQAKPISNARAAARRAAMMADEGEREVNHGANHEAEANNAKQTVKRLRSDAIHRGDYSHEMKQMEEADGDGGDIDSSDELLNSSAALSAIFRRLGDIEQQLRTNNNEIDGLKNDLHSQRLKFGERMLSLRDDLNTTLENGFDTVEAISATTSGIDDLVRELISQSESVNNEIVPKVEQTYDSIYELINELMNNDDENFRKIFETIQSSGAENVCDEVGSAVEEKLDEFLNSVTTKLETMENGITRTTELNIEKQLNEIKNSKKHIVAKFKQVHDSMLQDVKKHVSTEMASVQIGNNACFEQRFRIVDKQMQQIVKHVESKVEISQLATERLSVFNEIANKIDEQVGEIACKIDEQIGAIDIRLKTVDANVAGIKSNVNSNQEAYFMLKDKIEQVTQIGESLSDYSKNVKLLNEYIEDLIPLPTQNTDDNDNDEIDDNDNNNNNNNDNDETIGTNSLNSAISSSLLESISKTMDLKFGGIYEKLNELNDLQFRLQREVDVIGKISGQNGQHILDVAQKVTDIGGTVNSSMLDKLNTTLLSAPLIATNNTTQDTQITNQLEPFPSSNVLGTCGGSSNGDDVSGHEAKSEELQAPFVSGANINGDIGEACTSVNDSICSDISVNKLESTMADILDRLHRMSTILSESANFVTKKDLVLLQRNLVKNLMEIANGNDLMIGNVLVHNQIRSLIDQVMNTTNQQRMRLNGGDVETDVDNHELSDMDINSNNYKRHNFVHGAKIGVYVVLIGVLAVILSGLYFSDGICKLPQFEFVCSFTHAEQE